MTDESVNEDHRMKTYVSLDIGGTAIKYGLISDSAEIIFKGSTKTEAEKGGPEILKKVIGIVEDLLTRTQDTVSVFQQPVWWIQKRDLFFMRLR